MDYPPDLYRVHVVADNCTDGTAAVAVRFGASAHERFDDRHRGKGAALNWLIPRVLAGDTAADLVFVDADTRVSSNLLRAFGRELDGGAQVVQGLNLIAPSSDRPLTTLRALAFHLVCHVRPLAYQRLGVSVGLHGNGMSFRRDLVERLAWDEQVGVEDAALHLRLVRSGVVVRFARDAIVRSVVPDTLRGAHGQTVRWERGKFDLFRSGVAIVLAGLRHRDASSIVSGLDVLIPPFSVIVGAGALGLLFAVLTKDQLTLAVSLSGLGGAICYVARGSVLAQLRGRELLQIAMFSPSFVAWKLVVYGQVALGAGRGQWVRARRA